MYNSNKRNGGSANQKYFFTSDTHFGHGNIIKYSKRPFFGKKDQEHLTRIGSWDKEDPHNKWKISEEAVHLMNDTIINEINAIVGEDDVLWHLGDFAFSSKYDYYSRCKYYRDRIKCRNVNLVWGNHDERSIRDLFNETYDLKMISVPAQTNRMVLCHYAMAVWDGSHRGNLHLYGHSHSEAEVWLDKIMPGRRSMDVGVDNAAKLLGKYRPFSLTEIQDIFKNKGGFAFDHHVGESSNTPI